MGNRGEMEGKKSYLCSRSWPGLGQGWEQRETDGKKSYLCSRSRPGLGRL